MKPVGSLPTHTPTNTHFISAAGVLNPAVYFHLVSGLEKNTQTHTSVALIHLTDFKIPSATSKNPHPSYTPAHQPARPGAMPRCWVEQHTGERQTVCSGCLRHSSSSIVTLFHSSHIIIPAAVPSQHSNTDFPENKHIHTSVHISLLVTAKIRKLMFNFQQKL